MSSTVVTGITAITTISAITLSDDFSISDFYEQAKELGCWLNSWLPKNCIVRTLFYGTTTIIALRMVPFLLRKTVFFKNAEIQNRYFHRATFDPNLLAIKLNLLKELKDDTHKLPLRDDKLVLLELNAGGGTNLSYYPNDCTYIATDYWPDAKVYLEQNFADDDVDGPKLKLDRFINTIPERLISVPDNSVSAIICIHSLCSSSNVQIALLEMKRVLLPGGKVYFIEHVRTKTKYTRIWLSQLNFSIQMYMWDCSFIHPCMLVKLMKNAGFSVQSSEIELDSTSMARGPMSSLTPHIYGVAIN